MQPQDLWYGLTREEAAARCESLGLKSCFTLTMDPKAASPLETSTDKAQVPRVIRAKEENGAVELLFGLFDQGVQVIHGE